MLRFMGVPVLILVFVYICQGIERYPLRRYVFDLLGDAQRLVDALQGVSGDLRPLFGTGRF